MNGNNETKEVKQTSNEQMEKLCDLHKQVACDHAGLKEEYAVILACLQEVDKHLGELEARNAGIIDCINQTTTHILKIETSNKAMGDVLARYVITAPEPEPQPEKVDPPAEQPTGSDIVKPGPFGPGKKPDSGSGVVSKTDSQAAKGDGGVVSEKGKQDGKDGSGL